MTEPAWCARSGGDPHPTAAEGFGRCGGCGRRVRLLSSGKLRRHRVETQITMTADGPARAPLPARQ